jgi:predicted negative regulator of RcsB-dependent stress response
MIKGPRKPESKPVTVLTRSEQLKRWAEQHASKLVGASVALLVLFAVVFGISYYRESMERSRQAEYAQLISRWPGYDVKNSGNPTEPLNVQELEKLIPELQGFIKENRGSKVAAKAQLDLARAYFETGKYEEAVTLALNALELLPGDRDIRALVRYQLALTYAAMGKKDEAAAAWNALREEGIKGMSREALWQLGMLEAGAGNYSRAVERYEEALKTEGSYPTAQLLQSELMSLKAKIGLSAAPGENPPSSGQEPKVN